MGGGNKEVIESNESLRQEAVRLDWVGDKYAIGYYIISLELSHSHLIREHNIIS